VITLSPSLAEEADSSPAPTSRRSRRWVVAAGVPTVVTAMHSAYYGQWIVDDAGLSFAYARALTSGAGPVLQPGADPVEGYSNPAWVAILAVGRWLRLFDHGAWFGTPDIIAFPKLVGLLCCFGIFAAMFAIAATVTRRPVAVTIVAGLLTAMVPSFVIWTSSGLENGLFALAVVALAAVLVRAAVAGRLLTVGTAVGVGTLAALAALTRPDGVIYVAALPLAAVLTVNRSTAREALRASGIAVAAFAAPVGVYLLWRLFVFDDYLPNTARAKQQAWPSLGDLNRPAVLVGYVGWLTVLLGVAVITVALIHRSPTRTAVAMVLVPLGLALASFTLLQPDWMLQFRFATPVWPLAAIAASVAAVAVIPSASMRTKALVALLVTVAAASSLSGLWASEKAFRVEPTVGVCNVAQNAGYLFNGYADIIGVRDGSLLAVDGGGTSLVSRLRFVDLSGLGDRRIARFWQDHDMPGLRDHVFGDVRPTFIKIFNGWAERDQLGLARDPRMNRDYVLIFAGAPGGGDWVRRDAVTDRGTFATARKWGRDSWNLLNTRYPRNSPPVWSCGDVLRPTPFRDRVPAPSPLTRTESRGRT
jgi:hypothetical protein